MIEFPIYIMHYTKNVKRKELLSKILDKEISSYGFKGNCFWIENFDKEDLTYTEYYNSFSANHLTHQQRQPTEYFPRYPLQPEVVSLCLKHKEAIKKFIRDDSLGDICLFLEDDAILYENFFQKLEDYMKTLPEDFDAAFIGQGCGKHVESSTSDIFWYAKSYPADRNTDSILFTRKFLKVIYPNLEHYRIAFPIDHEYSFWFRILNAYVYWLEPPIVTQGSQVGLFDSFQPEHSRYIDSNMHVRSDLKDFIK